MAFFDHANNEQELFIDSCNINERRRGAVAYNYCAKSTFYWTSGRRGRETPIQVVVALMTTTCLSHLLPPPFCLPLWPLSSRVKEAAPRTARISFRIGCTRKFIVLPINNDCVYVDNRIIPSWPNASLTLLYLTLLVSQFERHWLAVVASLSNWIEGQHTVGVSDANDWRFLIKD